jgi:hypothetical protein
MVRYGIIQEVCFSKKCFSSDEFLLLNESYKRLSYFLTENIVTVNILLFRKS